MIKKLCLLFVLLFIISIAHAEQKEVYCEDISFQLPERFVYYQSSDIKDENDVSSQAARLIIESFSATAVGFTQDYSEVMLIQCKPSDKASYDNLMMMQEESLKTSIRQNYLSSGVEVYDVGMISNGYVKWLYIQGYNKSEKIYYLDYSTIWQGKEYAFFFQYNEKNPDYEDSYKKLIENSKPKISIIEIYDGIKLNIPSSFFTIAKGITTEDIPEAIEREEIEFYFDKDICYLFGADTNNRYHFQIYVENYPEEVDLSAYTQDELSMLLFGFWNSNKNQKYESTTVELLESADNIYFIQRLDKDGYIRFVYTTFKNGKKIQLDVQSINFTSPLYGMALSDRDIRSIDCIAANMIFGNNQKYNEEYKKYNKYNLPTKTQVYINTEDSMLSIDVPVDYLVYGNNNKESDLIIKLGPYDKTYVDYLLSSNHADAYGINYITDEHYFTFHHSNVRNKTEFEKLDEIEKSEWNSFYSNQQGIDLSNLISKEFKEINGYEYLVYSIKEEDDYILTVYFTVTNSNIYHFRFHDKVDSSSIPITLHEDIVSSLNELKNTSSGTETSEPLSASELPVYESINESTNALTPVENVVKYKYILKKDEKYIEGLYTGELVNGIPHGYGIFISDNYTFIGDWVSGIPIESNTSYTEGNTSVKNNEFIVGDYVKYGTYPQKNGGTDNTPIDWIILDRTDQAVLLLSRYGLDAMSYNKGSEKKEWESSDIRSWLNNDFVDKAFTIKEILGINHTNVSNNSSQENNSLVNNKADTTDQIFLLSYAEANKYLGVVQGSEENIGSMIKPTAYAITKGAYTSSKYKIDNGHTTWWWLRSSSDGRRTANVNTRGAYDETLFYDSTGCIRPAMWVDINVLAEITEVNELNN